MANFKSSVTMLQEMMIQQGAGVPEYECLSQAGPDHCKVFEYKCSAKGVSITAWGRSKKEAKQDVARRMLLELSGKSLEAMELEPPKQIETQSYVALLKELCAEYHLPAVEYELVGDTGPAHSRQFTIRAYMDQTERTATATTKKMARQAAAQALYSYLRNNLSNYTKDFVEKDAIVRAHEKVMKRYTEVKEQTWKPDLGQKISEYHLGIVNHIVPEQCKEAYELLQDPSIYDLEEYELEEKVKTVCACLGLSMEWSELDGEEHPLPVLELAPITPPLAISDFTREKTLRRTLDYLKLSLSFTPTKIVTSPAAEVPEAQDSSILCTP